MKLILFHLSIHKDNLDFPLASASLKAALDASFKEQELQTGILNPSLDETPDIWLEQIREEHPQVLGFSVYTWNRKALCDLSKRIKDEFPEMQILMGGAEATASPIALLQQSEADYILPGEGEESLRELMGHLIQNNKPPLRDYWVCSENHSRPCPAPETQWNSLPSPWLTVIPRLKPYRALLWELTRGCPYRCAFCFESRGSGKVRTLSMERFSKELEVIIQSEAEEVFVLDPTFNHNKKRCRKILNQLIQRQPQCHFTFEIRLENLDESQADLFAQVNCALQIGLQSSSAEVCKEINRFLDPQDFREKAALLHNRQIPFGLDLIYGLPGDNLQGFRNSVNYALSLQPSNLEIFPLILLEGTELYEKSEHYSIRQGDRDFNGWQHPTFPAEDMRSAAELAGATEIFYSWAMAPDWVPRLAISLNCQPVEIMEKFAHWITSSDSSDPSLFLDQLLGSKREWIPLRELIRLYHCFWLIHRQESSSHSLLPPSSQILELQYSPEDLQELMEMEDQNFISFFVPFPSPWVIFLDDQGDICWESLTPEAYEVLQKMQQGMNIESLNRDYPSFPVDKFIDYGIKQGFLSA